MILDNYYLHAINAEDSFTRETTLVKLEDILKTGHLLSRKMRGDSDLEKGGYNGLNYISLCNYSMKDTAPYENIQFFKGYTSYTKYIKLSLSLILNKKSLKVINPTLLPPSVFDWDSLREMRYLGNHPKARFTDMPDEVQVKNKISLQNFERITLPISYMIDETKTKNNNRDMIIIFLKDINTLLRKYNYIKSIYDLDTLIEMKEDNNVDEVLQKLNV